jgi:prefoldin subunit 5
MTLSELTSLFNLFAEALGTLQTDKSEVRAAEEALNTAQSVLAKETADLGGSTSSLSEAAEGLKSGIDSIVAEVTGG